jgi:hypothetical protein
MRGAIPPLPSMTSWRGAQLKSSGTTYLYLELLFVDVCKEKRYWGTVCSLCKYIHHELNRKVILSA